MCLGQIVWVWEKLERQANEMLDTVIYASAAAYRHGVQAISDVGWQKPREQWETYPPIGDPPPRVISFAPLRLAR